MTKEEAIKILESKMDGSVDTSYEWAETVRMAIEALSDEASAETHGVCSDIISREEVLRVIITAGEVEPDLRYTHLHDVIKSLPSVEPETRCIAQIKIDRNDIEDFVRETVNEMVGKIAEPKTGEWMADGSCSKCGCQPWYEHDIHTLNFCPNCGARMEDD